LAGVSYTAGEARQQLLDSIASAAEQLAQALALLTEAYEQLDEHGADELEGQVFKPVQRAYARARRTYSEFARRHGLATRELAEAPRAAPAHGVRELIDGAVGAVAEADTAIATLQDSMLPVEVGDVELRAGLTDVRALLGEVAVRARSLTRTFGR
jgi:hypothetical protein